jgi:hypothetical protein
MDSDRPDRQKLIECLLKGLNQYRGIRRCVRQQGKANMLNRLVEIMRDAQCSPTLVDVGASGDIPDVWRPVAHLSTFVGFDPDLREMRCEQGGVFRKAFYINKAVTDNQQLETAKFFLTASPFCSSTLRPMPEALAAWAFDDLFHVVKETSVAATSLNQAVADCGVSSIDWLKLDAQGADLRIYKSLEPHLKARLLAVDVEPGLLDAYEGEDLFSEVHAFMRSEGFWLSDLQVRGTARIGKGARALPVLRGCVATHELAIRRIRQSPGWCEARYLRTEEWLESQGVSDETTFMLAVFAMLDNQPGFALDLVHSLCPDRSDITPLQQIRDLAVTKILTDSDPLRGNRTFLSRLCALFRNRHKGA